MAIGSWGSRIPILILYLLFLDHRAVATGTLMGWGGVGWYKEQIGTLTNAVQVSCGSVHHGVVRLADGTVRVFGNNSYGQLNIPEGLSNVVDVAGGGGHCLALKSDGTVVAWGNNHLGQAVVPAWLPRNIVDIAAGSFVNFALLDDSTVISWPGGASPELNRDFSAISAGGGGFCAGLKRDGTVAAWGDNSSGQINIPRGLTNVTKIAVGASHVAALRADGTVVVWGGNSAGQCNVPGGLSNVVSIGAATFHTIALQADGKVVAWGGNEYGQLETPREYHDFSDIFTTPVGNLAITQLPVLIGQPANAEVAAGSDISFHVEAVASGPIRYQWVKNGEPISAGTNATLQVVNAQAANAGVYHADVNTTAGTILSSNATLTVLPSLPIVHHFPGRIDLLDGDSTNLWVVARGSEPMSYQWQFKGVPLPGATNSTLQLENIRGEDSGGYSVRVENEAGTRIAGPVPLTVFIRPKILSTVTNLNWLAGGDYVIQAQTEGSYSPTYSWHTTGSRDLASTSNNLLLRDVQAGDAGEFYLTVTSRLGSVTGLVARVTVTDRAPVILRQPEDRTLKPGETSHLGVSAAGTEPLSYQWHKDGLAIPSATNSGIIFTNMTLTDSGSYHVVVSNRLGTITSRNAAVSSNTVEQFDWPSVAFEPVANHSSSLTQITHAGDGTGRLFALEQRGQVVLLKNGIFNETPFLTLTNKVLLGAERGLLGIAFPDDFEQERAFYVHYTRRPDGWSVVSRFRVTDDADLADPTSEQVLLTQPRMSPLHNGGQIAFGPDGYLYIAMGDANLPFNQRVSQNPANFLGKLLRIDVSGGATNYTVPPGNPFVGRSDHLPEIWALGLRNPWRFSFDRITGDMFIGDVGNQLEEEIDFQPAQSGGANYGWPHFEGNRSGWPLGTNGPASRFAFPAATFNRTESTAIIGGVVHRGPPGERLYGLYICADYINGNLWGLRREGTNWNKVLLGKTGVPVTSFGEDEAGNIYVTSHSRVLRLFDPLRAVPPTFSPSGGTFNQAQRVEIRSATVDATIHYTLDGTDPTINSPSIPSGESVLLSSNLTLKARAFRDHLGQSDLTATNYNFIVHLLFSHRGSVTNGTPVEITSTAPGSTIWYTVDGTDPTTNSPVYTGPVVLHGNQWLKAGAVAPGWSPSRLYAEYIGLLEFEPVVIQRIAGTGNPGTNDGPGATAQFNSPTGITVDKERNIFVVDSANKTLRKISPQGEVLTAATGFVDPVGATVDQEGNVYVSDHGAYKIIKITPQGEQSVYAGTGEQGFEDGPALQAKFALLAEIEMSPSGDLYAIDGGAIRKISSDGIVSYIAESFGNSGLAARGDGLYRADQEGIIFTIIPGQNEVPYAGSSLQPHSDGERHAARFMDFEVVNRFVARAMAAGPDGSLFVADPFYIRRISPEGRVTTWLEEPLLPERYRSEIQLCTGIAVDDRGIVYISDHADHSIKRIAPDVDHDKVPDFDETHPLVVGVDDRTIDTDGDGASNADEYHAGTNPALDVAVRITVTRQNADISVSWAPTAGHKYRLQQSRDLRTWDDVASGEPSESPILLQTGAEQAFFRLVKH